MPTACPPFDVLSPHYFILSILLHAYNKNLGFVLCGHMLTRNVLAVPHPPYLLSSRYLQVVFCFMLTTSLQYIFVFLLLEKCSPSEYHDRYFFSILTAPLVALCPSCVSLRVTPPIVPTFKLPTRTPARRRGESASLDAVTISTFQQCFVYSVVNIQMLPSPSMSCLTRLFSSSCPGFRSEVPFSWVFCLT